MHTFSKEALERPYRTLQAIGVVRGQALAISRAAQDARANELAVAIVQRDLSFGGTWIIARENLNRQLPALEDQGGWSFTFSPAASLAQVEEQCLQLMRVAFKRWEAMQRRAIHQANQ